MGFICWDKKKKVNWILKRLLVCLQALMLALVLSIDSLALRQSHSRSSSHFHSYGSFVEVELNSSDLRAQTPFPLWNLLTFIHPKKINSRHKTKINFCSSEMPASRFCLPVTQVHVLVLHFQLQPLHPKPCSVSNVSPHSGGSCNSANAQQSWGTFLWGWALL